jgi:hypothetical protein
MARKRHTAEESVAKLRQFDVLMAQGRPVADAVRAIGMTEVTYYRWRSRGHWSDFCSESGLPMIAATQRLKLRPCGRHRS